MGVFNQRIRVRVRPGSSPTPDQQLSAWSAFLAAGAAVEKAYLCERPTAKTDHELAKTIGEIFAAAEERQRQDKCQRTVLSAEREKAMEKRLLSSIGSFSQLSKERIAAEHEESVATEGWRIEEAEREEARAREAEPFRTPKSLEACKETLLKADAAASFSGSSLHWDACKELVVQSRTPVKAFRERAEGATQEEQKDILHDLLAAEAAQRRAERTEAELRAKREALQKKLPDLIEVRLTIAEGQQ